MNGIDFIPVKPMMARCQKVLPLVYDDSLSYYEVLCKVQKKTNDLIHNVNEFFEWATQHESDYDALVQRVGRVENEIDTFEYQIQLEFAQLKEEQQEAFDEQTRKLDAKLIEFKAEIDRTLTDLRNQFTLLKRQVEQDISQMKVEIAREMARLNNLIDANNQYIFEYVATTLQEFIDNFPEMADVPVYNPIRGGTTTLQRCINDLYSVACVNGITCIQFDTLGKTAEEFDALGITAQDFDQQSYILLGYPDERWYMLSPFTGQWTLVKNVVMDLAHFHMTGLTATEYDGLDITADEWDDWNDTHTGGQELTAFNYDWFGKDILTA